MQLAAVQELAACCASVHLRMCIDVRCSVTRPHCAGRASCALSGHGLAAHKTAPPRTRVLICDEAKRVQIGRAAGLRRFDDAGHLLSV